MNSLSHKLTSRSNYLPLNPGGGYDVFIESQTGIFGHKHAMESGKRASAPSGLNRGSWQQHLVVLGERVVKSHVKI